MAYMMHRLYDEVDKGGNLFIIESKQRNRAYETIVYKIEKDGRKTILDMDIYYSRSEAVLGHQDYINDVEG